MHRTIRWFQGIAGQAQKLIAVIALTGVFAISAVVPVAAQEKPNILIIWGDDIGPFNISAYNRGMMGYKTPNIDRIARLIRAATV